VQMLYRQTERERVRWLAEEGSSPQRYMDALSAAYNADWVYVGQLEQRFDEALAPFQATLAALKAEGKKA